MRAIGDYLTAEESAALVAACRSLEHRCAFRHLGRNPTIGLDCAGMLIWAFQQIGRKPVDLKAYGREPHKDGLREMLIANLGQPLPKESMRAGDVALMRFKGAPRHVGLITALADGRLGLIHVHSENKVVAEHGLASYHGDVVAIWRP